MLGNFGLRLEKMSSKLYLGFALPALTLIGIGSFALYSFARIDQKIGTIYDDRIVPMEQLKKISDQYGISVIDAVNKAHAGRLSTAAALDAVQTATATIDVSWQTYLRTNLTPEETALVEQTKILFEQAKPQILALQQALQQGDRAKLDQFDGQLYDVIDPLTQKIQELIDLQLRVAQAERQDAARLYQQTQAVFIGLLVLALLLASPLGYAISRMITRTLSQTISAIAQATSEIATATEQQERILSQQAASVNQTTATLDQLSVFSQKTAQQADTVAIESEESLHLTENGSHATRQALKRINDLKQKVSLIASQINQLREQTQQIGSISTLVKDLADQTNMLALNAAVEAVRAGEKGKGFAIVAGEIRKLADESRQSSDRINSLVQEIQTLIKATVAVTEAGESTVQESVTAVETSAAAFDRVAQAAQTVVLAGQQISLSTDQQTKAIQEVLTTMHSLNRAAVETANGIGQTKVATQQLNSTVSGLKGMV